MNLYSSPNVIREIKSKRTRRLGRIARIGEKRNAYSVLVGKHATNIPLGRPKHR